MDKGYENFLMADPSFYDALHSVQTAGESFPTVERVLPDGWQRSEQDEWIVFKSESTPLPAQGWKIHSSATMDNAERIVDVVWDYCVPRGIPFKFLRSLAALRSRVSKYAPRGYSGKLVTIYPVDDHACETILRELGELLEGEPNPYILTDLRWGKGPLFVRYGAFVTRYTVNGKDVVPAIADADGSLVPDRRDPVFTVPPWVSLPEFLVPHLSARNAVTVAELPYVIERVIHFSNGGGVYVGRDTRTDTQVILKEGRPHSGIDAVGHDAVRRLEREYEILRRLQGIPGIPKVYDLLSLGEHRFMVMEWIEGRPLNSMIVTGYPMGDLKAQPADYARYTDWAMNIYRQAEATLDAIHERGIVYGDLHLFNIMVHGDDSIALLDFEVAVPVEESTGRPGLGNQGFMAPRGTSGFALDRYALACLQLTLFLPMANLIGLHRPKARHFVEIITEQFPVPPDYFAEALDRIVPPDTPIAPSPQIEPDVAKWPQLRDDLVRAILASATPERADRLFPGDIQQFVVGGLGLAYGAAGVLYALSVTGAGRYPQFEDWLLSRVKKIPSGTLPGLYDGLHGAAFTLDHLGYRQEALDTLDICLREKWETLGSDLKGGLAGIGLNLLHFADRTGEPGLRSVAHRAAELVAERLDGQDFDADALDGITGEKVSGRGEPWAGLMRGWSGQALLLLRTYDDTGDTGLLDLAAVALQQDLQRCVLLPDGALAVNEGWRTMPYLETGAVGIGLVLDEYLARRHDERFTKANHAAQLAACSTMYVLPELFTGRAGILLYLAGRSPEPRTDPLVAKQVRNLAWHAVPYADGIAFPGTLMLRLSMDLATGTAGVLLALGSVLHDEPVHAPLLAPTRRLTRYTPQTPAPAGAGT